MPRRLPLALSLFATILLLLGLLAGCGGGGIGGGQEQVENCATEVDSNGKKMIFMLAYDIWTMNANGSDLNQLTATRELQENEPAWSPDGKKIAFTRPSPESDEGHTSSAEPEDVPYLFVMYADGSCQSKLLDSTASGPSWSPDGKRIAYSDYRDDGTGSSIYVVDADGSDDPRRLTSETPGIRDTSPAWSPDGKKIAFESNRPNGRRLNNYMDIYVMKACCEEGATNQPQRLTDKPGWNVDPEWSPDSIEIAFTHLDFDPAPLYGNSAIINTDVYKMDADGSKETRFTPMSSSTNFEHNPAWSPSGSQVALVRGYYPGIPGTRSGPSAEIYVMKSDGSDSILVRRFPEDVVMDLAWR